jgi:hypothetical protein
LEREFFFYGNMGLLVGLLLLINTGLLAAAGLRILVELWYSITMQDGEASGGADRSTAGHSRVSAATTSPLVEPSLDVAGVDENGVEPGSRAETTEKDPRKIARKYVFQSVYFVSHERRILPESSSSLN